MFQLAKLVASNVLALNGFDGIQFGTRCKKTQIMPSAAWGKLLVWHSSQRTSYVIKDVSPTRTITLAAFATWQDGSFLLYYRYRTLEDTEAKDLIDRPSDMDYD